MRRTVPPCRSARGDGSWPKPARPSPSRTSHQSPPVLQPGAAPWQQNRSGGCVRHPEAARGEQRIHRQQPVQEAAERIRRARWTAVVGSGVDVVADGERHHRGADLVVGECSTQREEGAGPGLGDRPQVEALGSTDLQDGPHSDHPRMMPYDQGRVGDEFVSAPRLMGGRRSGRGSAGRNGVHGHSPHPRHISGTAFQRVGERGPPGAGLTPSPGTAASSPGPRTPASSTTAPAPPGCGRSTPSGSPRPRRP